MFTIGTAAYKLYSASSQVGSTLSTLSNYHKYVTEAIFNSPSEVENLHPLVKQNLDRLCRRIQVLSSPLNYCLLWSQHRGSAVAETIHQSKEVLKQTYHWLHQCNKDKTKLSDKEYMLKKLDEHIREIDFCLQALNLALSIIQTTDSNRNSNANTSPINSISPSSLLTASNRIMAMHNSGGDVSICFGQLFRKLIVNNTGQWQRIYRRCALKIYRNGIRRSYELRIECNEYGYSSDDEFGNDIMNESYPLTLKFDLTSSIYFTTLSSLIIDLPKNASFTKSNLNINNLNKNDLIEDAFGWVKMIANQVQEQYIFVLKSGLDDWDKPLSSSDDQQIPPQPQVQPQMQAIPTQNLHRKKQTSLIFLKDNHKQEEEEEEHINISDDENDNNIIHNHNTIHNNNQNNPVNDYHLTASMASLNTAVIRTKRRTHLGSLLAPGGDYDETHVTPQLMAYMTRLAIYENDYTKPHNVHHMNSTFKQYNTNNMNNTQMEQENDLKMNGREDSFVIHNVLSKQQSNGSSISNSSSLSQSQSQSQSQSTSNSNSNGGVNISEYDSISNDEYKIKQQEKIPAHLNASDEELYLFLRNPPMPPIPFYPTNVHFTNNKKNKYKYQRNKSQNANANVRQYRRLNTRKSHHKKSTRPYKSNINNKKNKAYFAAPNNNNNKEVVITYMDNNNNNNNNNMDKQPRKKESLQIRDCDKNDENISLSISDENHMKYIQKLNANNQNMNMNNQNNINDITPKRKKSMAAIADAANSSLLENVTLTASQTLSALNSPRNETNESDNLHGNFANLSIDNDD